MKSLLGKIYSSSRARRLREICWLLFSLTLNMPPIPYQALADVPQAFYYQGKLSNPAGEPYTGTYNMVFRIFDVETAGTALWTETRNGQSVTNGIFSLELGTVTAIPVGLFQSATFFLEVEISTPGQSSEVLVPRERLLASPFAFHSYEAERVSATADFAVYAGGLERMRVVSTGAVGIGTAVPAVGSKLTVWGGTISVPSNATGAAGPNYSFIGDSNTGMYSPAADHLGFATGGLERVRIIANGNVGIGTDNPGSVLHVHNGTITVPGGGSAAAPEYSFIGDTNTGIFSSGLDTLNFATSGLERLRINSAGQVGLGTNSPVSLFTVSGGSITVPVGSATGPSYSFNGDLDTGLYSAGANTLNWSTGGFERVRVDSLGRVGIGAVAPSVKFEVAAGTIAVPGNTTGSGGPNYTFIGDTDTGLYSGSLDNIGFATGGRERMLINASGNVGINGAADTTTNIRLNVGGGTMTVASGGDANGPTYSFNGDTNTGIYSPLLDNVGIVTGGVERLRVDAGGWTTIGTTVQGSTLTVAGAAQLNAIAAPAVSIGATTRLYYDSALNALRISLNGGAYTSVDTNTGDDLANPMTTTLNLDGTGADLGTTNQPGITISTDVFFGTGQIISTYTMATGALNIYGLLQASSASFITTGNLGLSVSSSAILAVNGGQVGIGTNNPVTWFQVGASTLVVTSGGFVGIGTTNPAQKLEVSGGTITVPGGVAGGHAGPNYSFIGDTDTGMYSPLADELGFATGGVERFRINDSGNVGIGGAADATTKIRMAVYGGTITVPGGSNADGPVYSFNGDTNTGMYSSAADVLDFATNGFRRLTIASGGNIGIGGVSGPDSVRLSITGGTITVPSGDSAGPTYSFAGDTNTGIYSGALDNVRLVTNGSDRLTVNNLGNVGIGAAPDLTTSIRLTVSGGTVAVPSGGNANGPTYSFIGDTNTGIYSPGTDQLSFATNGSDRMIIGATGNVGIGTTAAPTGSNRFAIYGGTITLPGGNDANGPTYSFIGDTNTGIYTGGFDSLKMVTGGVERIVIGNTGNVGIGTNLPPLNSIKLQVNGGTITVPSGGNAAGPEYSFNGDTNMGIYSSGADTLNFATNGAERMIIDSTGLVGIGTSAPAAGKKLDVQGEVQINFPTAGATTIGVCKSGADGGSGDHNLVECSATPADIAEWYETIPGIEAGDLVSFSDELTDYEAHGATYDGFIYSLGQQKISVLKKTSKPYQQNVIGVVSTAPIEIYGEDLKSSSKVKNPKPVALAGRVPIKVTTENGPIKPGDPLTSSSKPGYAMKASKSGRVVAIALEPFGEVQSSENSQLATRSSASGASGAASSANGRNSQLIREGKVLGFVNLHDWVEPADYQALYAEIEHLKTQVSALKSEQSKK